MYIVTTASQGIVLKTIKIIIFMGLSYMAKSIIYVC